MLKINVDNLTVDHSTRSYLYDNQPFSGIGEYYENGILLAETEFKKGIKDGLTKFWYPSGNLELEATFREGAGHGTAKEWYENRQLKKERIFEWGIVTKRKVWNETGILIENFELKESDDQYRILLIFRNRHKIEDILQVNTSFITFDHDKYLYCYEDKPFSGFSLEYHLDGCISSENEYKDGRKDGVVRTWYESGNLEAEGTFYHGLWKKWYDAGQLKSETMVEYGIISWKKTWDEAGKIIEDFRLTEEHLNYDILVSLKKRFGNLEI